MKCNHCGAEIKENSVFCSECGNKIDVPKQKFCQKCGHVLSSDSKFCPECGASIAASSADNNMKTPEEPFASPSRSEASFQGSNQQQQSNGTASEYHSPNTVPPYSQKQSSAQKWKKILSKKWNSLDLFLKIVTVALGAASLLLIIAVLSHRVIASIISIMQIVGLVLVWQMHLGRIKGTDDRTKKIVLGIMLAFFVLNFASRSFPSFNRIVKHNSDSKPTKTYTMPHTTDENEYYTEDETIDNRDLPMTETDETTASNMNEIDTTTQKEETQPSAITTTEATTSTTKPTTTTTTAKPTTTKTTTKKETTKSTTSKEEATVYYSTNNRETVKQGNSGVYAYSGDINPNLYYIIDFDKGFVYRFTDDETNTCERIKIDSGNLNDVLIFTYHDGNSKWSNGLHFRWKNQPNHLILQDEDGFEWDFSPTNLNSAIKIRDQKKMIDY